MKLTKKILEKYVKDGWLISQVHPTLPLTIWNYSQTTQYEGKWDDVTLSCRGLITDNNTGEILVRPFPKFFNYEEVIGKDMIPTRGDYVYVQEKMDGSLGILFNYKGEWVMATRGSFTSDQAIRGMEILKRDYPVFDKVWMKEYAYLVEIIYPENRIVVDYGKEKITFLSVVLNSGFSGWKPTDETELHWTMACSIFAANGIRKSDIVKTEQYFNFSDELYKSLKEKNDINKEGFVLRYFPGNFRMKIKFEEYVRLHRIMTNLSTTAVWEVVSAEGKMENLLKDVPDEFFNKVNEVVKDLCTRFENIKRDYTSYFLDITNRVVLTDRKTFAEEAKKYNYSVLLFKLADGEDISSAIWKIIKPKFKKL